MTSLGGFARLSYSLVKPKLFFVQDFARLGLSMLTKDRATACQPSLPLFSCAWGKLGNFNPFEPRQMITLGQCCNRVHIIIHLYIFRGGWVGTETCVVASHCCKD